MTQLIASISITAIAPTNSTGQTNIRKPQNASSIFDEVSISKSLLKISAAGIKPAK